MKIFAIDSTSAVARVAVTDDNHLVKEICSPNVHWNDMTAGNIDGIMQDFLQIIANFFEEEDFCWDDIDHICYSGYSGFQVSMNLGKIIAHTLGKIYKKEVIPVDHITAHYFSLFMNKKEDQIFPKLIYSASGSHNSLVYMKDWENLVVLNDQTYFDPEEGKYIGLGSIYNRILCSLDILKVDQSPQQIPEVLKNLEEIYDKEFVHILKKNYRNRNVFDLDMFQYFQTCNKALQKMRGNIDEAILFLSFQQSMFEILSEKFDVITEIMPVKEIAIVGGISQNDDFYHFLEEKCRKHNIVISRPFEDFRFDNAGMLGILSWHQKKNKILYPISQIVT